jgi:hypothetical protein
MVEHSSGGLERVSKNLAWAVQDKLLKTSANRTVEGIAGNFTGKR